MIPALITQVIRNDRGLVKQGPAFFILTVQNAERICEAPPFAVRTETAGALFEKLDHAAVKQGPAASTSQ